MLALTKDPCVTGKDVSPKRASNAEHRTRCIKSALTFRHSPPWEQINSAELKSFGREIWTRYAHSFPSRRSQDSRKFYANKKCITIIAFEMISLWLQSAVPLSFSMHFIVPREIVESWILTIIVILANRNRFRNDFFSAGNRYHIITPILYSILLQCYE